MTAIRAACHVHSEWSYDGKWSLAKIAAVFFQRGYRAVLLSEHDRGFSESRRLEHREACRKCSSGDILLVPGIEYSDEQNCVHILVWGNVPFIGENVDSDSTLAAVGTSGGAAVLAHPSRKEAWRHFKPDWQMNLAGIECWNRKSDGWAPSIDARRLLQRNGAAPFVGMDFHDHRQFFPFVTWLELDSSISESSILTSLRARRCRSEAFGIAVTRFSHPCSDAILRTAEFLRRRASYLYRTFAAYWRSLSVRCVRRTEDDVVAPRGLKETQPPGHG